MSASPTKETIEKDLNVTLPIDDVHRIKEDAVKLRVPLKEYALVVFRKFRGQSIESRRAAFCNSKPKTVGRKVESAK